MGLFSSKSAPAPTLHEVHSGANEQALRALNLFHSVASDLRDAAEQHANVANEAQAQIDQLTTLRDAASAAGTDRIRQAEAVAQLVS